MRKLIFWLALCAGLIATPAVARDGAWYVGGEFGAMIVEDTNVDIGTVDNALRLNYDYGYDGGLFVGYDLGGFRIEAEAAYKKADLDSYTTTIRLPLEGVVFPSSRLAGGNTSAMSFMINGMLDFGDDDGISGFVGGGVGMARVKANNQRNFANATPFLDDSDSKLAWQVFAGVRQAINDHIDVTVKYRFFNVDKVRMTAWNGQEAELRFRSHSLLGGITFNFGKRGPECNPPYEWVNSQCVPPCEAGMVRGPNGACMCPTGAVREPDGQCRTPCPDGQVRNPDTKRCECPADTAWDGTTCKPVETPCPKGTIRNPYGECVPLPNHIVYFGWDEREIGVPGRNEEDEARIRSQRAQLEAAYADLEKYGDVSLQIVGHADRSGKDGYNQELSCDRAHSIRDYFIQRGVNPSSIQIEGRGEGDRAIETADGVREPMNRRVAITIGGDTSLAGCPPPSGK